MMTKKQILYIYLCIIFTVSLVVSNLIFQKFFHWYPFDMSVLGVKLFELSVGILPYPITFLITDFVSEIYGKKAANNIVLMGLTGSLFSLVIVITGDLLPQVDYSPIDSDIYHRVFAVSPIAVVSSMTAYLFAQFLDIRIYHFWKKYTQGKHLWLRNNCSTFISQFIDSFVVILLLTLFDILSYDIFWGLVVSSFLFKILIAILDTPLLYLSVYLYQKFMPKEL